MNPEDLFFGYTDDDFNWLDLLAGAGSIGGDLGGLLFDTETGQFVDAASVAPADIGDWNIPASSPTAPFTLSGDDTGLSPRDMLRQALTPSLAAQGYSLDPAQYANSYFSFDPITGDVTALGSNPSSVAHFPGFSTALDASGIDRSGGGGSSLAKALSGLGGLGNALGKGLSGLAGSPQSLGIPNGGPIMGAPSLPGLSAAPGAGGGLSASTSGAGDVASPGSLSAPGSLRADPTNPIAVALSRLQADPGTRIPMQAALEMKTPAPFTPLTIPLNGSAPIQAVPASAAQRLSGLQRLALERLG